MSGASLGFRRAEARTGPAGTVALSVGLGPDGRTHPVRTDSRGVLRLMQSLRLDDSGQVAYFVVNPGGAYFGEVCRMDVEVAAGASLLLSSQGATRIYRTPNAPAVQEASFTVREGARLEYVPDQAIAYRDADYRQITQLTLAANAQAFLGEIITPGWDPDGRPFTYTDLRLRVDVRVDADRLVVSDNVRITPATIGPAIDGIGYLEGASHMGSALAFGPHVASTEYADAVHALVEKSGLTRAGVTSGNRHGVSWLMVRALAGSTDALTALVLDVNEHDRAVTTGQKRLHLRRY